MAKKVMTKLKEVIEKEGPKISVTENGKEGKSKMIASWRMTCVKCSKEKGLTLDFGRRLESKSPEVGSKRRSEKKEVQIEVLDYQEAYIISNKKHESRRQEVAARRV